MGDWVPTQIKPVICNNKLGPFKSCIVTNSDYRPSKNCHWEKYTKKKAKEKGKITANKTTETGRVADMYTLAKASALFRNACLIDNKRNLTWLCGLWVQNQNTSLSWWSIFKNPIDFFLPKNNRIITKMYSRLECRHTC